MPGEAALLQRLVFQMCVLCYVGDAGRMLAPSTRVGLDVQ
jgi:hypothetical protein